MIKMLEKEKGKGRGDIMDKSPGDVKAKPQVPKFRGEDGYGGDSNSTKEETKCVNYER